MPSTQFGQTKPMPHGHAWRDCNAAGLAHLWVKSHTVVDKGYLALYWRCKRASCSVGTRTTGHPTWRPKGVL